MSAMVNIMLFIICFNAAVSAVNISQVFSRDDSIVFNSSLPNANQAEIDARILSMNNTQNSDSEYFGQNIFSSALQDLRGAASAITGLADSLRLFMVGVISPGQILQTMCEELAQDPNATGLCNTSTGLGQLIQWINRLVYVMYFIFIIQFVANRSYKGMG